MTLEPGLEAAFRYTVTEADTARRSAAGEVPVLATPWVLALAEQATVAAVAGALAAGVTTVGTRVELDHLAPSPVGADLEVAAVLDAAWTLDGLARRVRVQGDLYRCAQHRAAGRGRPNYAAHPPCPPAGDRPGSLAPWTSPATGRSASTATAP